MAASCSARGSTVLKQCSGGRAGSGKLDAYANGSVSLRYCTRQVTHGPRGVPRGVPRAGARGGNEPRASGGPMPSGAPPGPPPVLEEGPRGGGGGAPGAPDPRVPFSTRIQSHAHDPGLSERGLERGRRAH